MANSTYKFGVSEGALLRNNEAQELVVWFPVIEEWRPYTELQDWVESRPVSVEQAKEEFPGCPLDGPVVFGPDTPDEGEPE